jgi:putative transposase
MIAGEELARSVGTLAACQALGLARASVYRRRDAALLPPVAPHRRPTPARALADEERRAVLGKLHEDRFVDKAPSEVYATLLDEGEYLCAERTMYRILASCKEVRERRDQLRHPVYKKPELLATAPNQVWTWDITKLRGPGKWVYYYLYVLLDIFSRYVVGWMVAHQESAILAKRLLGKAYLDQGIRPGQLSVHSDRGPSMQSKPVALLLADLGVVKSHSRPHVSNDNPFSEAQFKTLKYRPDFPDRFDSSGHASEFCRAFFPWYNLKHRHSGLGLLTPAMVHYGKAEEVIAARRIVLQAAYEAHPERFVRKPPSPPVLHEAVWINPPHERGELLAGSLGDLGAGEAGFPAAPMVGRVDETGERLPCPDADSGAEEASVKPRVGLYTPPFAPFPGEEPGRALGELIVPSRDTVPFDSKFALHVSQNR